MDNKFGNPAEIKDSSYRFDSFDDGKTLYKKKRRLPAMGWNSWNAFGNGNSEALTKAMAEKMVELGLDKLGYIFVILDDGCYSASRVDGHLKADEVRFPGDFKEISDFVRKKGLKFGMYNDIGSKLCSGLEVGTCGYEDVDTRDYVNWNVEFLKVDNCYNVWDNATFSDPENAKYTFAPNIFSIKLCKPGCNSNEAIFMSAVEDGIITGSRAYIEGDHVTGLGTFDGTGPDASPVGEQSSELRFVINVEDAGEYQLVVYYEPGSKEGVGQWLQVAAGLGEDAEYFYDGFISENTEEENRENESQVNDISGKRVSEKIKIRLKAGENILRLMNHRRQENTLTSYARIQEGFSKLGKDLDIILSICEWGKTQPHNWGYKVGDSWRILNDITFQVGSDGDSGHASWEGAYTTSVTAQYNKCVIMDEFAGLEKGWNDPDMLMIGMNGLTETMCRTHMTMWSMMNSPLMLGMDLRNVNVGDAVYNIITNKDVIEINQDALGVQAKRIFTTKAVEPDKAYIRDNDRIDVLAKPLADGSIALSYINVSTADRQDTITVSLDMIKGYIGAKMEDPDQFFNADSYELFDIWSKEKRVISKTEICRNGFCSEPLKACDSLTYRITPIMNI